MVVRGYETDRILDSTRMHCYAKDAGNGRGIDMSPNRNSFMQDLMEILDSASRLAADAQRARTMDVLMMGTVLPLFNDIAKSPVWGTLNEVVKDAAAQMLEEESFSPCDAAKPARHLLQALETIKRGGEEMKRWATDDRFIEQKRPKKTFKTLLISSPQPRVCVPVAEIVEQLAYLMGLLSMAAQEANLASQTIIHMRDPLLHIVSKQTPLNLPQVEPLEFFIPLATGRYASTGDKGRDLLNCLEQFGDFLILVAERGRQRLYSASVDDKAFSPGVVAAEAISISNIVKNGLSTCNALAIVAPQYIGESVTIQYTK